LEVNHLPASIRNSKIFSGHHLSQLASVNEIPMVNPAFEDEKLKNIFQYFSTDPIEMERELHAYAKELLNEGKVAEAWQVLLALV
jgi:aspartate aminotransferase-like enzyme